MLYSIVIATKDWNSAVVKSINSVLCQSIGDFELIVQVHLGSFNADIDVNLDPRAHIYFEDDSGIYDALNRGVRKSSGEYVLFLGDGDYLIDRFVLEDFSRNLGAGIEAACGQVFYYTPVNGADVVSRIFKSVNRRILKSDVRRGNPVHTQGLFVKRSLYLANPFSGGFRILADFDFLVRSEIWRTLRYFPRPVAMFMEGGASTNSLRAAQVRREAIKILWSHGIIPSVGLFLAAIFHSSASSVRKMSSKNCK
jgi:glycosyltransferase involved in cell wall biosynthesis